MKAPNTLIILAALSAAIITGCATNRPGHGNGSGPGIATGVTKAQGWTCNALRFTITKNAILDGETVSADDRNEANAARDCKRVYDAGIRVTIYDYSGDKLYAFVKFEMDSRIAPHQWFAVSKLSINH